MSDPKGAEISLKVMINKQKTKVLFAEADSDFVDVLLSFLTLPLGTIVRVLNKQDQVFGSLTSLYKGLKKLDNDNFWSEGGKQMLLSPRSSFESDCRKHKLNVDDTQPSYFFRCGDGDCKRRVSLISMYHDKVKCDCGKYMSKAMDAIVSNADSDSDDGVFIKKHVSFLITDDLRMAPAVPGSMIETLADLGITIPSGAEPRTVTMGLSDVMDFLRGALLSSTPFTDLVLRKGCTSGGFLGYSRRPRLMEEPSSFNSKKMIVYAWVRESDLKYLKLLFVAAEADFVDFLFGLLIIPFGGVEFLLGRSTSLKNIDNLYTSIENLKDEKYWKAANTRSRLMTPEIPPNYLSKNHVFSLAEQPNPVVYFFESNAHSPKHAVEKCSCMRFKDPKGNGSYVKRPGEFLVFPDLSVPNYMNTEYALEFIEEVYPNFSVVDIKVLELHIGLEEALNILEASLTSKDPLSDALYDQISEKLQAE